MSDLHSALMHNEPLRFTKNELDALLSHAIALNTSDITLQTNEVIFGEIYGQLKRLTKRALSNTEVGDVINGIYGPNGTAQLLSGQDLDTHYEYRPSRGIRHRFRVNATSCQTSGHDGIQITLRSIPYEPPTLTSMTLPPDILAAIAPHQGIVYITGATGSGKSTLLAAIIRELVEKEAGNRKVLTYESPIEFVYDMLEKPSSVVSQMEIPRHLPSFAAGVRNALRRKPGLILVGESRDKETIAASIEAALTGHPVYTTLHSNGVPETLRRLVTSFPSDERGGRIIDILETIRLVIWQKLVPTVDGKRVALREYLIFDEQVRDILINTPPEHLIQRTRELLNTYGQPMLIDAKQKFDEGIIPEREYQMLAAGAKLLD